jgi:hypothetical protein
MSNNNKHTQEIPRMEQRYKEEEQEEEHSNT